MKVQKRDASFLHVRPRDRGVVQHDAVNHPLGMRRFLVGLGQRKR
jgi:hypothetical protein